MVTVSNNLAAFLQQFLNTDIQRYGNAARDWGTREARGYKEELEQACALQYTPKNEKDSLRLINLVTDLVKRENCARILGGATLKRLREALLGTVDFARLDNLAQTYPKCAHCGREFARGEMMSMGETADIFFCTVCIKPNSVACVDGHDYDCPDRPGVGDRLMKLLFSEMKGAKCSYHKSKPPEVAKAKLTAAEMWAGALIDPPVAVGIMNADDNNDNNRINPFEEVLFDEPAPVGEVERPNLGGPIPANQPFEANRGELLQFSPPAEPQFNPHLLVGEGIRQNVVAERRGDIENVRRAFNAAGFGGNRRIVNR